MLISFSFILLLQAQWGQPTALGFSILSGGLVIAAMNEPEYEEEEEESDEEEIKDPSSEEEVAHELPNYDL